MMYGHYDLKRGFPQSSDDSNVVVFGGRRTKTAYSIDLSYLMKLSAH